MFRSILILLWNKRSFLYSRSCRITIEKLQKSADGAQGILKSLPISKAELKQFSKPRPTKMPTPKKIDVTIYPVNIGNTFKSQATQKQETKPTEEENKRAKEKWEGFEVFSVLFPTPRNASNTDKKQKQ